MLPPLIILPNRSPGRLLIPARYQQAHRSGIERLVRTVETRIIGSTLEVTALRKDGTEFPIELSLGTWGAAEARSFIGIIRDLSERKQLIEALTESRARVAAILESANDAIISIDRAGRVSSGTPTPSGSSGTPPPR